MIERHRAMIHSKARRDRSKARRVHCPGDRASSRSARRTPDSIALRILSSRRGGMAVRRAGFPALATDRRPARPRRDRPRAVRVRRPGDGGSPPRRAIAPPETPPPTPLARSGPVGGAPGSARWRRPTSRRDEATPLRKRLRFLPSRIESPPLPGRTTSQSLGRAAQNRARLGRPGRRGRAFGAARSSASCLARGRRRQERPRLLLLSHRGGGSSLPLRHHPRGSLPLRRFHLGPRPPSCPAVR
jgi:hypothetical protein